MGGYFPPFFVGAKVPLRGTPLSQTFGLPALLGVGEPNSAPPKASPKLRRGGPAKPVEWCATEGSAVGEADNLAPPAGELAPQATERVLRGSCQRS